MKKKKRLLWKISSTLAMTKLKANRILLAKLPKSSTFLSMEASLSDSEKNAIETSSAIKAHSASNINFELVHYFSTFIKVCFKNIIFFSGDYLMVDLTSPDGDKVEIGRAKALRMSEGTAEISSYWSSDDRGI